jgi:predicted Zn-dependent protease
MRQLRLWRAGFSPVTLADRARDAGQWSVAARLYRKALDRNPRNPPIWVQYGQVMKEWGNVAEAGGRIERRSNSIPMQRIRIGNWATRSMRAPARTAAT